MKNFIKLSITVILASLIAFSASSCNFTSMLTQEPQETTQAQSTEDNDINVGNDDTDDNDTDDNDTDDNDTDDNDTDDNDTNDNGDLEDAVHNSFSDAFCKQINKSELLSMEMGTEGNNVLWKFTLKKDLNEAQLKLFKNRIKKNNLTKQLPSIKSASGLNKDKQDFGLIVRYYTKDGKLILEQKSK